jgi:putative flippase GtrA
VIDLALTDTKLSETGLEERDPEALLPSRRTADLLAPPPRRAIDRAVVIQFVQFCLVGALSTVLNVVLLNVFMGRGLGVIPSHIFSFSLAVTNGFFLNRAWTFRHSRDGRVERQYVMFVLVNLVGLGLSMVIVLIVGRWMIRAGSADSLARLYLAVTGKHPVARQLAYSLGELAATPLCAVWNFSANMLWTFSGARANEGTR